jgi:hypothetical protein
MAFFARRNGQAGEVEPVAHGLPEPPPEEQLSFADRTLKGMTGFTLADLQKAAEFAAMRLEGYDKKLSAIEARLDGMSDALDRIAVALEGFPKLAKPPARSDGAKFQRNLPR